LPDNGFSKTQRLLKRREFQRVFDGGMKVVTPTLVFFWLNNGCVQPRLGLVVSKKAGKAVRRNRIKRMIREAFRLSHTDFSGAPDVVVIPRFGAFEQRLEEYLLSFRILQRKIRKQGTRS
jgi:ribonuclease P protein component